MASVTTTQLYSCSDKIVVDNMKASKCDYVTAKLYLKTQAVGWTTPWSDKCFWQCDLLTMFFYHYHSLCSLGTFPLHNSNK